jgi:hypothetical protein
MYVAIALDFRNLGIHEIANYLRSTLVRSSFRQVDSKDTNYQHFRLPKQYPGTSNSCFTSYGTHEEA